MNEAQLGQIWNWLPTFRAVAETEHLPTAAARLHVSPSAISRTIRLLEEHLGVALFNRTGRNLVLNTSGQRLLEAVRQAMSSVDTGVEAVTVDPFEGRLRISALGLLTNHFVLPALLDLKRRHRDLVPMLSNYRTTEANQRLVTGRLDVAFYYEALSHPDLLIERVGSTTASVYCGVGHPLFGDADATIDDVLDHEFSVPAIGDSGQAMDGWPPDLPRKIGMHIWLLTTNLHVCLSGVMVTVLPDVTALPHVTAGQLRRFPLDALPHIEMFAAIHRLRGARSSARAAIDAVACEIDEANGRIREVMG